MKQSKQYAAMIVFTPATTAAQVRKALTKLQNDLSKGKGAKIQYIQTKEFNPDWGGVVIYQP